MYIYNLNISQVVRHTFYRQCLFVHDNSVCQKCFDLVFRSNQKLRKILKCFVRKRNGYYFRYCHTQIELYFSSSHRCIDYVNVGRSSAFIKRRPVIKIHGATFFQE